MNLRTKLLLALAAALVFVIILLAPYYFFVTHDLHVSPLKTMLGIDGFKSVDNKVTILLLGIPGEPHDGPYLSDSIVLMNYDFKKNTVVTINIPRDIWSPPLGDKINAAYAQGEAKKKGEGLALARAQSAQIVGRPIYYGAVVNFAGFHDMIDFLGGVDVEVAQPFTDKKYPIAGRENDLCGGRDENYPCRYETITFAKGETHMDGTIALKFVRSRNAQGDEGSDFARGRRQEKVVSAVRAKVARILFSFDLAKIKKLYALADKTVSRNLSNQQAAILLKDVLFARGAKSSNFALREDLFIVPPTYVYGKYVLVPKGGSSALQKYINCLIDVGNEKSCRQL